MPSNTSGGNADLNGSNGTSGRKSKQAKPADPEETSKLVQAKYQELEQSRAEEREQAAEIEREAKKASRALQSQIEKLSDPNKQIEHLLKRSSEFAAEMKRFENENKKLKKKGDALQKERDTTRAELAKKVKLEPLCRQLQNHNNDLRANKKALLEEKTSLAQQSDEKIAGLLAKLDRKQDEMDGSAPHVGGGYTPEQADAIRNQFKSFSEQFELRDLHFQSQMRAKELEALYHQARYERERKRLEGLTSQSRSLKQELSESQKREAALKDQLNVYIEKFKQVEDTLNNSNTLFLNFRREMEDMSRKTRRLERDNETMRRKHDAKDANIYSMAQELKDLRAERDGSRKKLEEETRRADKFRDIIRGMQQQGRKVTPSAVAALENSSGPENGESDYSGAEDEDEDEDDEEEEHGSGEYDNDEESSSSGEEDVNRPIPIRAPLKKPGPSQRPLGADRPPPEPSTNGH